jgi:DNA-binding transcriptional LysR family regulator
MRPRLDQLEAFVWISKLGSFRGAARKLRVSQPAISSRIRELETELGMCLLDRSGPRPQMTAEGLEVLRHAEQMIGLAEDFRARFCAQPRLPKSIRMGSADSFALTYLSSLLERLAELHPETHVDLEVGFSATLDRKLQAGELDLAFITQPTDNAAVCIEPVLDVEVAWMASPKLGLHQQSVKPKDLHRHLILTNPHPSYLYGTMQDWFGGGIVPQRLHTCTSLMFHPSADRRAARTGARPACGAGRKARATLASDLGGLPHRFRAEEPRACRDACARGAGERPQRHRRGVIEDGVHQRALSMNGNRVGMPMAFERMRDQRIHQFGLGQAARLP